MSTNQTGRRDSIGSHASMVYHRLSFEDDIFTARVYKRNYRSPRLQRFWKRKPNIDHETIASRDEKSQVVGAHLMAPTFSNAFTIDHSSSQGIKLYVNTKMNTLEAGHVTDSHIFDIRSERDDQRPRETLLEMCRTTTGDHVIPGLTYSRECDSLHVCPIHSSLIEDKEYMERLLQNWKPGYASQWLTKLMYCERGVRWLPLHVFALIRDLPVVQLLLRKGLSVNAEMGH